MTRLVMAIGASALLFGAPLTAFAADETAPASQGQPAASKEAGCMPGGGCCGSPACAAPKHEDAKAAGGCPCQKAKQAAEQQQKQQQPPAP
jgi:hypothetical protein